MNGEPKIKVALMQNAPEARLNLSGFFVLPDGRPLSGEFSAQAGDKDVVLSDASGVAIASQKDILLMPSSPAENFFTVRNIQIGIDFHWQRLQEQSFRGGFLLTHSGPGLFHLINMIGMEEYLASVISSEMSADAPLEFMKAQAITARSWLAAMLEKKTLPRPAQERNENEVRLWQDVNDHEEFDVCADDHCQRYQGITRIISDNVARAINATRGVFLTSEGRICDARYYKCCGGRTEIFSSAWEDRSFDYLSSVADSGEAHPQVCSEQDAADWLGRKPDAYCNTNDKALLERILPAFDLETLDFFRWRVVYERRELENILREKSGIDFGRLHRLVPLARGPSGRIYRLKIEGSKKSMIVGKELEIRRRLSPTHLLSSAFIVTAEQGPDGGVQRFILSGGGWGHGVGLCQIGAAVMAAKGFSASDILAHYFTGAELKKLYGS